jgi:hypothetical protein
MKPKLLVSAVFMLFAVVLMGVPTNANAEVLFQENFEGYAVGSSASDKFYSPFGGRWVTEEGGNKFFRSLPFAESDYLTYTLPQFPDNVTIEFLTRQTLGRQQLDVGLANTFYEHANDPGSWQFYPWVSTNFYGINVWWVPGAGPAVFHSSVLGTFSVDWSIWHDVKMTLDESIAKFYFDDLFLYEYNVSQDIPVPIENFHLFWQTFGQRDLDNITVTGVPEPSTLLLLGSGLAGLGGVAWRRHRRK